MSEWLVSHASPYMSYRCFIGLSAVDCEGHGKSLQSFSHLSNDSEEFFLLTFTSFRLQSITLTQLYTESHSTVCPAGSLFAHPTGENVSVWCGGDLENIARHQ